MLQNAEEELLECLAEECSEVIKAKSKITRFGKTPDRVNHLREEIADVMSCIAMLLEEMGMTEEEEKQYFQIAEASVKKRYSYMKFKPKKNPDEVINGTK